MSPVKAQSPLVVIIALAVTSAWLIVALATIVTKEYTALTIMTPVMLIVAGFLFGRRESKNGR